jgi:hypothetical protein
MDEKMTVIPLPTDLQDMALEQLRQWLAPTHASLVAVELQRESASEAPAESSSPETEPDLSSDSDSYKARRTLSLQLTWLGDW